MSECTDTDVVFTADGECVKRCSKCFEVWPLTTEFYYPSRIKNRDWTCRACVIEKAALKKRQTLKRKKPAAPVLEFPAWPN